MLSNTILNILGCPDSLPPDIVRRSDIVDEVFYRYCQAGMVYITPSDIPTSVKQVRISGNPITAILNDTFDKLEDCELLSLAYNEIYTLEVHAFRWMLSLKVLYLNDNNILFLRKGVFDLKGDFDPNTRPTLSEIYLQNNRMTILTTGIFTNLISSEILVTLNMTGNDWVGVDEDVVRQLDKINADVFSGKLNDYKIRFQKSEM